MMRWITSLGLALALAACASSEDDAGEGSASTTTGTTDATSAQDAAATDGQATAGAGGSAQEPTADPADQDATGADASQGPADGATVDAQDPALDGRSLVPEGHCAANASSRTPCHDDPDPCGLDSGYPGDEFCILPPPAGTGVQIHLGPDDYDDPAALEPYLLGAGEEVNVYALADIPTSDDHYYNFVQIRMRPSSHHLINRIVSKQPEEGFIDQFDCPGEILGTFVGAQSPVRDDPAYGVVAPENEGLGRFLAGDSSMCINQHAYNFGEEPVLREVWINVYFMDAGDVTQTENPIVVNAPVGRIPPGEQRMLEATATIIGDGRITSLAGHRHAWTDRFAVWHNDRLVYDSWDWVESVTFDYNSVTENPPINSDAGFDGAVSGMLEVSDGDEIRILCDVNNQSDYTLRFANEAYSGEMCILFGRSVGALVGRGGF
ncbi:MAG: hypothetical protein PVI30_18915 [Myxococcales bacterium]|jgi:hypothetical protein